MLGTAQSLDTSTCTTCRECCGFDCQSYDDTAGCKLSATGDLLHPRKLPPGMCFHELKECLSCSAAPFEWRSAPMHPSATLRVSGDCHRLQWGVVDWPHTVRLTGALVGPATIRGACPLVLLAAGGSITDITFFCTSGAAAVEVESGRGSTLTNVTAVHASAFRAAHADGVDLAGFSASVSSNHRVMAAIGNGIGAFDVHCLSSGSVAVQRLKGSTSRYSGACDVVDVGTLLGAFGTTYETRFYHKNAEDDVDATVADTLFTYTWQLALALFVVFGITHEDYSAIRTVASQYT